MIKQFEKTIKPLNDELAESLGIKKVNIKHIKSDYELVVVADDMRPGYQLITVDKNTAIFEKAPF